MKKAYIIVPVLALIVFVAFYWQFNSTYQAKQAAKERQVREQREEKLRKEAADRERAIKDAVAASEQRKREREEREARDKANREARDLARQARNKAESDVMKLNKQVDRLKADVEDEKQAIAKIEEDKKQAASEEAFLRKYVTQAQANVKNLTGVLDKISAADAAAEAAARAAARSKKDNS